MTTANNLYEGHRELVDRLRKRVDDALRLPVTAPGGGQMLKDATTAYVMAVDKFLSFHSSMTLADGSKVSSFGFTFKPESIDPT